MNTWNEIFSANLGKIMAIQTACAKYVVKNRDWNVDFDRGIISFGEDEYPLQFLGSEANSSNTWLWAWKNINGFDENIISLARKIKAKGEKLNLEALTTAEIEITDELNGHIFLSWNKNEYKWKENTLIADFENSQKLEIDFEEKSELARIINIRLNS